MANRGLGSDLSDKVIFRLAAYKLPPLAYLVTQLVAECS